MNQVPLIKDFINRQYLILDDSAELVIKNIIEYIQSINKHDAATGNVWGSKELDKLVVDIAERLLKKRERQHYIDDKNEIYVYVVSQLYKTGGHTSALFELIASQKNCRHVILVTNVFECFDEKGFREYLSESIASAADLVVAPSGSYVEKIKYLQAKVFALSPKALFLFNHHEDVVAIASSPESSCDNIFYYHHADHHLALGVYLEYSIHIDPHNIGYYNCKKHLQLSNIIYWPLVVTDKGGRDASELFMPEEELKTCTCASANKIEKEYVYEYKDIVLGRLKHVEGLHYHIGNLSQNYLDAIYEELKSNEISLERFIYVGWVDSVWLFLLENKIDLVISSFPIGGGTTTLECFGSGIPIIMHDSYETQFHSGIELAYENVMRWSTPSDLYTLLNNLDEKSLREHSLLGREFYKKYHAPELLDDVLNDLSTMKKGLEPAKESKRSSDIDVVVKKINAGESFIQRKYKRIINERDLAVKDRDLIIKDRELVKQDRELIKQDRNSLRNESDNVIRDRELAINECQLVIHEQELEINQRDDAINKFEKDFQLLTRQLNQCVLEVQAYRNSISWKITRPLRGVFRLLRGEYRYRKISRANIKKLLSEVKKLFHIPFIELDSLPSDFDQKWYSVLNPDLPADIDLVKHFLMHGRNEGRYYTGPELSKDFECQNNKETVLIVGHEASRTGAPILSLNLVQRLLEKYKVMVLLLAGGPLTDSFRRAGAAVMDLPNLSNIDRAVSLLCESYDFKYALVNSIESRMALPSLAINFVPTISLIHEFASYVRPKTSFKDAVFWSGEIVFSASLTLDNARAEFPELNNRFSYVLPQGRCEIPMGEYSQKFLFDEKKRLRNLVRPYGDGEETTVVVGAGYVQLRKGVDLFLECATRILQNSGDAKFRFIWVGKGYDPEHDAAYSVYLADQIRRAGLQGHVFFIGESPAVETVYQLADLFLLTSRLDPLPNVAIDAMACELPVICFDKTTGIADFLINCELNEYCVAGYLDTTDMANKVLALAGSIELRNFVAARCLESSTKYFNMKEYVSQLESLVLKVCLSSQQEKLDTQEIIESGLFRPDFSCQLSQQNQLINIAVRSYVRVWASEVDCRKPFPGFHPGVYTEQHGVVEVGADPFADYLRAGRPEGVWSYSVIESKDVDVSDLPCNNRVAMHLHVYFPELLEEMAKRLSCNQICPDLFISINNESVREIVESKLENYKGNIVSVKVVPNRGRDIGPILTEFGSEIIANYDYVGHIHTKKSVDVEDSNVGESWYKFLLENLLGGDAGAMADSILSSMKSNPSIGMVFPDDPNIIGWSDNYDIAESIAVRVGINQLPDNITFPIGTMFWATTGALRPFVELEYKWGDYPEEPLPYDGTMLHALERLFPLALSKNNLTFATTNVKGITR